MHLNPVLIPITFIGLSMPLADAHLEAPADGCGYGLLGSEFESCGLGFTSDQIAVQQLIVQAAQAAGIDPRIPLAVAAHESQFTANAQNPTSSAAGVMQLLSVTQKTLGVTNPYDPVQNVNAGVGLLAQYFNQYGSWPMALQAYADGPGTVQAGLPPSGMASGLISYVNSYDAGPILASLGVSDSSVASDGSSPDVGTIVAVSVAALAAALALA